MKIAIHGRHLDIPANLSALALDRLGAALDRFSSRIAAIDLRLADLNGPKGGPGIEALAVARLVGGGELVVRGTYVAAETAIGDVSHRLAALVRRVGGRALQLAHGRT
ncbi:MAG: HPF/RaiA family ribosome-associated protein [Planctomycetes bacterium]|nr:HPF/RaiA family ribosome-associated protein [Planctomycetota bacterium]